MLPAYGAQPRLSRSPLSKLINQPIITAIHRDSIGFLWIGTQEGLYKFDGADITIFNSDDSNKNWIPASDIRGISEDIDKNLLVATYGGGLIRWNNLLDAFEAIKHSEPIDDPHFTSLNVSEKGEIWVSTKDRIILHNQNFSAISKWISSKDVMRSIGRPYVFIEAESGILLVGGNIGLTRISILDRTIVNYDLSALEIQESFGVTALEINMEGDLVIGTDTGHLAVLDLDNGDIISRAKVGGDTKSFISDFLFYEGKLLIATDKGLYLSETNFSSIRDISRQGAGLSSSDIYRLYLDGKYAWIGTYNGLYVLSFSPFELFNNRNSAIHNDVLVFEQDSNGRIWVGTYSGLFIYDETSRSHSIFQLPSKSVSLVDQRITAMSASKNKMWLGFYQGGVQVIDIASGKSYIPDIENSNEMFVMDIFVAEDDRNVWVATDNHGLLKITPEKTYNYYKNGALSEKRVSLVFSTSEGNLIASATNKIYEYDAETDRFIFLEFKFGLGSIKPFVLNIAESQNGDIWFGTKDHGLFRWKKSNQKLQILDLEQVENYSDLKYSTIYGIELDLEGNIWCSTQNGIAKLNSKGSLVKRFSTADGLQGNDFTFGAAFTSQEGLIYFGGVNGYNRFNPNEIDIDSIASPMRLTGIKLPEKDDRNLGEIAELTSLQLTHKDHFVTFQFSVLDFIDPEGNQYRYMLENFDPDWIENGNRNTATYTNLPAGNYVLRVQGANSAGIWNHEGLTLGVHVLPAPWFTWWAFCTYGMSLLFLLWCGLRIYRSYAIERRSAELALEMFEAENRADDDMQEQLELQDELIHSAYHHNLATLSLVRDCITYQTNNQPEKNGWELVDGSTKRIVALSILEDYLFYQAGGPVANLHKYTDRIASRLLEDSPVSPGTIVTINELPTRTVPVELASPLAIILYELLENSIQHAFEAESPANYIHIKMVSGANSKPGARTIDLSVCDSGVGLPTGVEHLARENSGIAIVKAIVLQLGGTLEFSYNSGTTVLLTFPEPSRT